MVAVSGLVVMVLMADIVKGQYDDESNEKLVSVVVKTVVEVIEAVS